MKKWRCVVCGYVHEGETPPNECPVCGVGPEEFVLAEESVQPTKAGKRWKCTVCDYIHEGEEPPAECPVCGVGPDLFVLLEDDTRNLTAEAVEEANSGTASAALDVISYGLYVVTSLQGDKINGQCANTVFQLSSKPPLLAVCLNKRNLTNEYVSASGVFCVNVLGQEQMAAVKDFGYRSGRTVDKFAGIQYLRGKNGCPILSDGVAYLEAKVLPEKTTDANTHTLFIAEVTAGRVAAVAPALTYAYYRENKKGKSI